jgi:large subunit ribosomal protein L32
MRDGLHVPRKWGSHRRFRLRHRNSELRHLRYRNSDSAGDQTGNPDDPRFRTNASGHRRGASGSGNGIFHGIPHRYVGAPQGCHPSGTADRATPLPGQPPMQPYFQFPSPWEMSYSSDNLRTESILTEWRRFNQGVTAVAVPKKKTSKSRRDHRRANHDRIVQPAISDCIECGSPCIPHQACPECGVYRGRKVIEVADETTEAETP